MMFNHSDAGKTGFMGAGFGGTGDDAHPAPLPVILVSGGRVDPLAPNPAAICLRAIGEGLAKLPVLAGQTPAGWCSLAQRACHVADVLDPDAKGYGLLWDAPAAIGLDPSSPLLTLAPAARAIVEDWRAAIFTAAGLPPPDAQQRRAVETARARVLATETRDLAPDAAPPATRARPLPGRLTGWSWPAALDRWHARLERLGVARRNFSSINDL